MSSVQFSRSVVSDSLRPHEPQHARPPCLSPTPRAYPNSCKGYDRYPSLIWLTVGVWATYHNLWGKRRCDVEVRRTCIEFQFPKWFWYLSSQPSTTTSHLRNTVLRIKRINISVVSDSVRPHRQQPARLCHPWDSPGKNTGVGCHFLLQCMKVKGESEVAQSCLTLNELS